MKSETIGIHRAFEISKEVNEAKEKAASKFLKEDCETFNGRDLHYFVEKTGKPIEWVVRHGKNVNPVLKSAILSGCATIDDLWYYPH